VETRAPLRIERDLGPAACAPAEKVGTAAASAGTRDGQVGIGPRAAERAEHENARGDGVTGAQPEIGHGVDIGAREIGAGIEVPAAVDVGTEDVAFDADHDRTALP